MRTVTNQTTGNNTGHPPFYFIFLRQALFEDPFVFLSFRYRCDNSPKQMTHCMPVEDGTVQIGYLRLAATLWYGLLQFFFSMSFVGVRSGMQSTADAGVSTWK